MSEPDTLRRHDHASRPTRKALAWLALASLLVCLIAWLAWIAGWSWIP